MNKRDFTVFAIGAACVAVVAGGTTAIATSNGTHLCAAKHGGALRVASHCKSSERALVLGARGPRGEQGIQGKPGQPGTNASINGVTAGGA